LYFVTVSLNTEHCFQVLAVQEIIELTESLIRFKSMHSRPEEIRACAEFIGNYLSGHGVVWKRLDRDGVPSILALPNETSATVLLMSHIDVVDAPDELFVPAVREGRLYGRGSIDDKYAAALSMVLFKEHVRRCKESGGGQGDLPFGILITGDEEVGGKKGAKEALAEVRSKFCIALDGGGLNKIVAKEKGILRLKLISRGKSAHGARPWLGENAIEKLIADYLKIKPFFELSAPEHWHRTLNFSILQAGKSVNQVPDYAEALFDIRYTENDDVEALVEEMRKQIQGELAVEGREPLFHGGDSPYLDVLLSIAKDTTVGFEHGASDARYLSDYGIQGIVWGADGDMTQHSLEEHLNMESAFALYRILDAFMAWIAKGSV
jgi:succinyl-diaminopimelate desuccinylase